MTSTVIITAYLEKSSYVQGMNEGVINSIWTGYGQKVRKTNRFSAFWLRSSAESQKNIWRRGELGLSLHCIKSLESNSPLAIRYQSEICGGACTYVLESGV